MWLSRYLDNLEEREEGGTPDIVGAIRCGLAMRIKEAVGTSNIEALEKAHWDAVTSKWADCDAIELLGGQKGAKRLTIAAFMIRHQAKDGRAYYLHHNFVAALLNDLFGIQVRSGCMCAGPYALRLLGIETWLAREYEEVLLQVVSHSRGIFCNFSLHFCGFFCGVAAFPRVLRGGVVGRRRHRTPIPTATLTTSLHSFSLLISSHCLPLQGDELIRPGFVRLSLNYFSSDHVATFVGDAIRFIAEDGWRLLPAYTFLPETVRAIPLL